MSAHFQHIVSTSAHVALLGENDSMVAPDGDHPRMGVTAENGLQFITSTNGITV